MRIIYMCVCLPLKKLCICTRPFLYAQACWYTSTSWVNYTQVDWGGSFIRMPSPSGLIGNYCLNALRFPDFTVITASQAILELLQTSKMARNHGDTPVLGFKYLFNLNRWNLWTAGQSSLASFRPFIICIPSSISSFTIYFFFGLCKRKKKRQSHKLNSPRPFSKK